MNEQIPTPRTDELAQKLDSNAYTPYGITNELTDFARTLELEIGELKEYKEGYDIVVSKREEAWKERDQLKQEVERLKEATNKVFCPWCQTSYDKGNEPYAAINEHLNKCLKHPISQRDRALACAKELADVVNEIGDMPAGQATWPDSALDALYKYQTMMKEIEG